jgi:hypothetical protein
MLCDLKVILQEKEAYGLPADAVLLRANDVRIAYTVNAQNRAESVEIKCGITADGYSEILNHADYAGKKFVISGQTFLNNGALLSVISNEETK